MLDRDITLPCGAEDLGAGDGPEISILKLLTEHRRSLARFSQAAEATNEAVASILATQLFGTTRNRPSEMMVSGEEHSALLADLVELATSEILSMNPGAALSPGPPAAARRKDREVLQRGISMRRIHLASTTRHPRSFAHLAASAEAGIQVKLAAALPFRMTVIDRAVALCPVPDEESEMRALILRDPELVRLLGDLFEHFWLSADRFRVEPDDDLADPHYREVLALMATGCKDDVIAKQLSLSTRTLRRLIAELNQKLGTTSRFQLGIAAQARGLLPM